MKKYSAKDLILVIGDQNFSSWSMRAWLVIMASGLPFQSKKIILDQPDTQKKIRKVSPSLRVPVLLRGGEPIWDSLAIAETLAEMAPGRALWPRDARRRSLARSYAAEMHSGFASLRTEMTMDIRLRMTMTHFSRQTEGEILRIKKLWMDALKTSEGPFLFGEFGIVDAFYAPVVMRFRSYDVRFREKPLLQYQQRMLNQKYVKEWIAGASKEKIRPRSF